METGMNANRLPFPYVTVPCCNLKPLVLPPMAGSLVSDMPQFFNRRKILANTHAPRRALGNDKPNYDCPADVLSSGTVVTVFV